MKNYENLVDEHLEFMIRLACEAQEDAEIDELIAESQLEHIQRRKKSPGTPTCCFSASSPSRSKKNAKILAGAECNAYCRAQSASQPVWSSCWP